MSAQSFNLENSLTYRLHSLSKLIDNHADYADIQHADISFSEGRVLAVIGFYQTLSVLQLAKKANLDKSQGSRAVVSLVNKGLIEKLQNQHDARTYDLFFDPSQKSGHSPPLKRMLISQEKLTCPNALVQNLNSKL